MRSVPPAVAGGPSDCRFAIADCRLVLSLYANPKSPIDNLQSLGPPATAGGTDLIPKLRALFQLQLFKLPQFCVREKNVKRDVAAKNESAPTIEKALQPEIAMNEDQPGPEDH